MKLYPRLPLIIAESLVPTLSSETVENLKDRSDDIDHKDLRYAPTGGQKVAPRFLKELQHTVKACAQTHGYPSRSGADSYHEFDTECGILLHQNMNISPSEASHISVWYFMTCILMPDIVRWRFPGEDSTAEERFLGSSRGMRRNTFGRLWWRTYLLHEEDQSDPYMILRELNEDDLVQITERPSIAGNKYLARQIGNVLLAVSKSNSKIPRRELMRESIKRIRRLLPMISFEIIDLGKSQEWVEKVFQLTLAGTSSRLVSETSETGIHENQTKYKAEPGDTSRRANIETRVFTTDIMWEDVQSIEPGERVMLSGKDVKKKLNKILTKELFKGSYSERENYTDWSKGNISFRVHHKLKNDSGYSRAVERFS